MPGSRGLTESTNFFPSPRICHEDEIQEEGAEGEGGGKGRRGYLGRQHRPKRESQEPQGD